MIDTFAARLAEETPNLAALLIVVVAFIRYMKSRDAIITEVSSRCHKVQDHATQAQDRATKAIEENTKVLGAVLELLRRLNGRIIP